MYYNSLVIARQNMPITFINSEITLFRLLISSKELIWIVSFFNKNFYLYLPKFKSPAVIL